MKARKGLLPPNHPYYKKLAEPPQKTLEKFLTT
jgi:hypothetical protein